MPRHGFDSALPRGAVGIRQIRAVLLSLLPHFPIQQKEHDKHIKDGKKDVRHHGFPEQEHQNDKQHGHAGRDDHDGRPVPVAAFQIAAQRKQKSVIADEGNDQKQYFRKETDFLFPHEFERCRDVVDEEDDVRGTGSSY